MQRMRVAAAICAGLVLGCGEPLVDEEYGAAREMAISLTYRGPVYQGTFYSGYLPPTDHVVWIEDSQGTYIRTLEISAQAVTYGAHGSHVKHLPDWAGVSGETDSLVMARTDSVTNRVADEYDAITAASTKFRNVAKGDTVSAADTTRVVAWDLTDAAGARVSGGVYRFCVETANIKKDSVDGVPYPPDSILHESCCGTVNMTDSTVTAASATANILGVNALFVY